MPKVELHVHLEGSIRPETVLKLAERNQVELPARDIDGLHSWFAFTGFPHFVEVYVAITKCIKTPDDLELIAREFLEGQAAQNVLHSEVTYTASTIERFCGIPWADQLPALQRALAYGRDQLGISAGFILDIVRGSSPDKGLEVAKWAIDAKGKGVLALGLAGEEGRASAADYAESFALAHEAGLPITPHAGETCGPESIWDALNGTNPNRIGHGVRCVEDPKLVATLRDRQIPLEVCPSSNVCLGGVKSLSEHQLPQLLDEGLYVTIGSDDPPMFNTSITDEYLRIANEFDFDEDILWTLNLNAANAAFVSPDEKLSLVRRLREDFENALDDEDEE